MVALSSKHHGREWYQDLLDLIRQDVRYPGMSWRGYCCCSLVRIAIKEANVTSSFHSLQCAWLSFHPLSIRANCCPYSARKSLNEASRRAKASCCFSQPKPPPLHLHDCCLAIKKVAKVRASGVAARFLKAVEAKSLLLAQNQGLPTILKHQLINPHVTKSCLYQLLEAPLLPPIDYSTLWCACPGLEAAVPEI